MAFDECPPYPCSFDYAKKSMHMTNRWLDRCIEKLETTPFMEALFVMGCLIHSNGLLVQYRHALNARESGLRQMIV